MKTTESIPHDVSSVLSVIPSSTYNILSNLKHSREAVSRLYLYGVLGVGKHATEKEIKEAYRHKALKHHPDRNGGVESDEAHILPYFILNLILIYEMSFNDNDIKYLNINFILLILSIFILNFSSRKL